MKTLRDIASVLVLSGGAALFSAGCVGQADDGMDEESTEQAPTTAGAEQETLKAADEEAKDAAPKGEEEAIGESRDHFGWGWRGGWGGWRGGWGGWRGGWGGWRGGWGGWGGWGGRPWGGWYGRPWGWGGYVQPWVGYVPPPITYYQPYAPRCTVICQ